MKRIEEVLNDLQPLKAMPTGVKFLDENLGGLYPGELTTICGYANDGKTALMIRMIHHLCFDNDIPVLMILNNTNEQTFLSCMAAYYCGIICEDVHKVNVDHDGTKDYWKLLREKPFYMAHQEELKEERIEDLKKNMKNQGIRAVFVEEVSSFDFLRVRKDRTGVYLKGLAKELQVSMVVEQEFDNVCEEWCGWSPFCLTRFEQTDLVNHADNVIGIMDYANHENHDEQGRDMSGLVNLIIMKHKGLASIRKDVFLRRITLYCRDWRRAMEYEISDMVVANPHIQDLAQKFGCVLTEEVIL